MTRSDARFAALADAGLYVLFDPRTRRRWADDLAALAAAGVPWFQLRAKGADGGTLRRWAPALRRALAGRVWIVNDDIETARRLGADGVHLGPNDAAPATARRVLGARALIGVSGDDRRRLAAPGAAAADYAGIGAWRSTATKRDAGRPLGPRGTAAALALWGGPAVAIGGIRPGDAAVLKRIGVRAMAVYGGVWQASNPVAAARDYMRAWAAA